MDHAASDRTPVTYDTCDQVSGPFLHGTKATLEPGVYLVAGHTSNFQDGRVSNNIYFTPLESTAAWGAQLAAALAGLDDGGHIYVVEPLGPFEDDPNVTDKRFPGNPTRSYRTRAGLRVVEEVLEWEPPPPDQVAHIRARMAELAEFGIEALD